MSTNNLAFGVFDNAIAAASPTSPRVSVWSAESILGQARRGAFAVLAIGGAIFGIPAKAADLNYGKVGDPIHLVVGYQPYATVTWDGAVMRKKEFWRKYLPPGSSVEFKIGLQGAIIVNQMLAGKNHIGYLGDTPAVVATTKPEIADIRLVGVIDLDSLCHTIVVRKDAPQFKNSKEAVQWMNGKQVASAFTTCADRLARVVMKAENIKPAAYLNQSLEVISTGFRAGKLDASFMWEPTTSKLVEEGLVRVVGFGSDYKEWDNCYIAMRNDLIKQRPDVVKAMLNAELDAQLFMADPKNANEIINLVHEQVTGFSKKALWQALYGTYPGVAYPSDIRMNLPWVFNKEVTASVTKVAEFLHSIKAIGTSTLRPEAVMPEFAEQVLKERGMTAPLPPIRALPISEFKGN